MRGVDEDVGEAACFLVGTIETQQASIDHAGFALAARNGIGQPTRRAITKRAAVSWIVLLDTFTGAQLSIGTAACVYVRGIDDQRAAQCA